MSRTNLTSEQVQFLRDNYPVHSAVELTAIFNARFDADKTTQQIRTAVKNRGITSGRTGRFENGQKSWNSGSKGQGLTSANKTSFPKGNVPKNRKPLWTERICSKEGFVLMKVPERNPYTGTPTRYKHKHVYLWEHANGAVPKGMVVAFKDGNKLNCTLDNLMLITRAELLELNRQGYKEMPDELKPSLLALSRLNVKMCKRAKK